MPHYLIKTCVGDSNPQMSLPFEVKDVGYLIHYYGDDSEDCLNSLKKMMGDRYNRDVFYEVKTLVHR